MSIHDLLLRGGLVDRVAADASCQADMQREAGSLPQGRRLCEGKERVFSDGQQLLFLRLKPCLPQTAPCKRLLDSRECAFAPL